MQEHLLSLPKEINTPRLTLRRFRAGEGQAYFDLLQKNKAFLHDFPTTVRNNQSAIDSEKYLQKCIAQWYLQEVYFFAVCEKNSDKIIGMLRVFKINWKFPSAEIAYFLDDDYKRRGYISEGFQHLIPFCFDQLKMNKLRLITNITNKASQGVALKCGFEREGIHKSDFKIVDGSFIDVVSFGLTRERYEEVKI